MQLLLYKKTHSITTPLVSCYAIQLLNAIGFTICSISLMIYMIQRFNYSGDSAASIIGGFFVINYTTHLLIGFIAGKHYPQQELMLLGFILQIIGSIGLLIASIKISFILSLSCIGIGTGILTPNIYYYLITLSTNNSEAEHSIFMNFICYSVGGLIAALYAGHIQATQHYPTLFIILSLTNLSCLIILITRWNDFCKYSTSNTKPPNQQKKRLAIVLIATIALFISFNILMHEHQFTIYGYLLLLSGVVFQLFIKKRPINSPQSHWGLFLLFATCLLGVITLDFLSNSLMIYLLEYHTNHHLFNITIQPAWFNDIKGLSFITGGFIIFHNIARWEHNKGYIQPHYKVIAAVSIACLSALSILISMHYQTNSHLLNGYWIVLFFILIGIACVFSIIMQYGLARLLLTKTDRNIGLGIACYLNAIGSALSTNISHWCLAPSTTSHELLHHKVYVSFLYLSIFLAINAAVLILFRSKINNIIHRFLA